MQVQYVGKKALKYDNITQSSFRWTPGQINEVPDEIGRVLVKFPGVWEEVPAEEVPAAKVRPLKRANDGEVKVGQ